MLLSRVLRKVCIATFFHSIFLFVCLFEIVNTKIYVCCIYNVIYVVCFFSIMFHIPTAFAHNPANCCLPRNSYLCLEFFSSQNVPSSFQLIIRPSAHNYAIVIIKSENGKLTTSPIDKTIYQRTLACIVCTCIIGYAFVIFL